MSILELNLYLDYAPVHLVVTLQGDSSGAKAAVSRGAGQSGHGGPQR